MRRRVRPAVRPSSDSVSRISADALESANCRWWGGSIWPVSAAAIVYGTLKATVGLRLDPEEEFNGADLTIHKISATAHEVQL